jgi:septum formation inhibitor MinC
MDSTDHSHTAEERDGLVSARGTGDGLVIRLDGRAHYKVIRDSLDQFLSARRAFFSGNEVALEWVNALPNQTLMQDIADYLVTEFSITVRESKFREIQRVGGTDGQGAGLADSGRSSAIVSVRSGLPSDISGEVSVRRGKANGEKRGDLKQLGLRSIRDQKLTVHSKGLSDKNENLRDLRVSEEAVDDEVDSGRGPQGRKVSLFDGLEVTTDEDVLPNRRVAEIRDQERVLLNSSSSLGQRVGGASHSGLMSGYMDDAVGSQRAKGAVERFASRDKLKGVNPLVWDDPDTRTINMTLRSGQKIESDHTVVIRGDVNSGAEVVAGGDIIILGTLRGIAHAGAFDDSGGGRSIFALSMEPTQLRIGSLISRGKGDASEGSQGMEVARVEGNIIVVEPYVLRGAQAKPSVRR